MKRALLLLALLACHRSDVLENVPTTTSLASYRTAGLVLMRTYAIDDATMSDIHDDVLERVQQTKIFQSVKDGSNADLIVRVFVLSLGDGDVTLGVELNDVKKNTLIGRFQVHALPDRKGPSGGININVESKTSKAIASAAREIASYLEDHR